MTSKYTDSVFLDALREPKTTTEVAKELGIGSCTALQKLRKLYSAGLITKVLDGDIQKWVLEIHSTSEALSRELVALH